MTVQSDVGVVVVHGIGDQAEIETLTEATDAISRWAFTHAKKSLGNPKPPLLQRMDALQVQGEWSPRHALLEFKNTDDFATVPKKWLIAEAWWAQSFPEPSQRELLTWLIRVAPSLLVRHFSLREDQVARNTEDSFWIEQWIIVPFVYAFAWPISMVILAAVALLYAAGTIPIKGFDSIAPRVQRALSARLGDSFVYLSSPSRTTIIRSEVSKVIEWVAERCTHLTLISHSQGAAVTFDLLHEDIQTGKFTRPSTSQESSGRAARPLFVSLGQGIAKLTAIRSLMSKGKASIGVGTLGVFFLTLLWAMVGLFIPFRDYWVNTGEAMPGQFAGLPELVRAGLVVIASQPVLLLIFVFVFALRIAAEKSRQSRSGTLFTLVLFAMLLLVASFWLIWQLVPVRFSIYLFIGFILFFTLSYLGLVAESKFKPDVGAINSVANNFFWRDFYTPMDPVSNGPINDETDHLKLFKISNRRSALTDHTTYWLNIEEFVAQVVREISIFSGITSVEPDPVIQANTGKNIASTRDERLRKLVQWRWCIAGTWMAVFVSRDSHFLKQALPWDEFCLILGGVLYAIYLLVAASWEIWNQQELDAFVRKDPSIAEGGRRVRDFTTVTTLLAFLGMSLLAVALHL